MGFNSPYKAFDPQAIVPRPELTRLITYSTRLDDAALPHVFQVSSGIEPAGLSLTMGGADTEFRMLGEGNDNGSSSSNNFNAEGTNGNAGITQYNRDTIPVFYAAQDDDDDEDYNGVVVGCDMELVDYVRTEQPLQQKKLRSAMRPSTSRTSSLVFLDDLLTGGPGNQSLIMISGHSRSFGKINQKHPPTDVFLHSLQFPAIFLAKPFSISGQPVLDLYTWELDGDAAHTWLDPPLERHADTLGDRTPAGDGAQVHFEMRTG
ncbi:hypothetical protein BDD12DRAFT_977147 [Trichophaea hybrida]|nr:hypothetical protein BDD12DRAFT_977147 [Trichophaea hybrida]